MIISMNMRQLNYQTLQACSLLNLLQMLPLISGESEKAIKVKNDIVISKNFHAM